MSLDIAILTDEGAQGESVPLGTETHYALMQIVSGTQCKLLPRMNDYYADADFDSDEITLLLKEVKLVQQMSTDTRVTSSLQSIKDLCIKAMGLGKGLAVISD